MYVALPVVSGQKVIKALTKAGFTVQGKKGSHVKLKKREAGKVLIVIVPDHAEVARGTLKSILRQAGITKEEFLKLL
jgi:predicted RNA binding protein YcfA (HicA-like mRNA interferase family)